MAENEKIVLTEKCAAALAYLKANDNGTEGYLGVEIAEALGTDVMNAKGVHGVMNSLVKKGLVAKGSRQGKAVTKDGKEITKDYVTYYLTDAGRAFVIAE